MYTREKIVVNGSTEPIEGIRIAGNIFHVNSSHTESNLVPNSEKLIILLTHPNGFVKDMWQPFINEFLNHLEVLKIKNFVSKIISIDIRNQGDSALLNEGKLLEPPFKWIYNSQDILAVIKNLNLQGKNFIGIGSSIGGASLLVAETYQPGTFKRIISMDPPILFPHVKRTHKVEEKFRSSGDRRSVWPSREEARKHFEKHTFSQDWHPLVLNEYLEHGLKSNFNSSEVTLKCLPKEEMKVFMDDYEFQDNVLFDRISKVQCPTLLLAGDGPTGILNGDQLVAVVNQIPKAQYKIIPKTNHLLPYEDPKTTAIESAKFINAYVSQIDNFNSSQKKPKLSSKL